MRRTQLYLDDDTWQVLNTQARRTNTTVSELVRRAVRDRYVGNLDDRRTAMEAFVGIRRDQPALTSAVEEVQKMRRSRRAERLRDR